MTRPTPSMLERWKARGIVDDSAWPDLDALFARLPSFCRRGCFEIRLGPRQSRTDLAICLSRADDDDQTLRANLAARPALPEIRGVAPLLRDWMKEGTLLHRSVPLIWLEYDLPGGKASAPFPFVCVDSRVAGDWDAPAPSPASLRRLARRIGALLPGWDSPSAAAVRTLESCARALPEEGYVVHLAPHPPARGTEDLRVVFALPPERAWNWLCEIGWSGNPRHWKRARRLLGREESRIQIDLDLGEEVRPNLAVVFFEERPPAESRRWPQFMKRLVRAGLCTQRKKRALLRWVGDETWKPSEENWTVRVDRFAFVKLGVSADGAIEAKGYLAYYSRYTL